MEKRRLGRTDMDVTVLGFGGAEIGFEQAAQETVTRLLSAALDAGLNVIDTAECYMASEELIGKAVGHRRSDYYLITKVGHPDGWEIADWSMEGILAQIQRSLKRLRTDRLDLVHLHSCDAEVLARGEATAALQEARRRGYTRYIGYSGDSAAAVRALAGGAFDTLQTSVNVADQQAIDLLLPTARNRNIGVIAKRPVANVAWRTGQPPANDYHMEYWTRLQKLKFDFLDAPLDVAVGVALGFTLQVPGVHTAIVGTRNPDRWRANARLLEAGPLAAAVVERIRARWREVAPASWEGQT